MVVTWSLTICGVVLVAVEVGGWPYDQEFIMKVGDNEEASNFLCSRTLILFWALHASFSPSFSPS